MTTLRGSAKGNHPSAPMRLDSDSLIIMDGSDRGVDTSPANAEPPGNEAEAEGKSAPSTATTTTVAIGETVSTTISASTDQSGDHHNDDNGANATETSELERQQTDPSVRHKSQQILDLTSDQNGRSSVTTGVGTRRSSVGSSSGIPTADESADNASGSSRSFSSAPSTSVSTDNRQARSHDRPYRAKMEQESRASTASTVIKKSSDGVPKNKSAALAGAIATHGSSPRSAQRAKKILPNQLMDRNRSGGCADPSTSGISQMLEGNVDGINAKIAMYSHNDDTPTKQHDGNGPNEKNEEPEEDTISDAKRRQSHDEENLFRAPPNGSVIGLAESRGSANSSPCFIGALRGDRDPTEVSGPFEIEAERLQTSSVGDVQLSIANAVATDDLEEQIRQTIIGGAVHATEVTAIREDRTTDGDAAVLGNTTMKQASEIGEKTSEQQMVKKRRLHMLIGGICLVLIAIAVGVSIELSSGSSDNQDKDKAEASSPTDATKDPEVLRSQVSEWLKAETAVINPGILDDASSPQYRALEWLLSDVAFFDGAIDSSDSNLNITASHVKQRYALASIFYSTNGDTTWADKSKWLLEPDFCSWSTVFCDSDGFVDALKMPSNNLTGTIPPEIGILTTMTTVNMARNPFSGGSITGDPKLNATASEISAIPPGLPTTIGLLTNLEQLRIGYTNFASPIPTEIGNCASLTAFLFKKAGLAGTIPSEMDKLNALTTLDLHDNAMTGQLPAELGDLPAISTFVVSDNKLKGTIPASYTKWPAPLDRISLGGNEFDQGAVEQTLCGLGNPAVSMSFMCGAECTCCTGCD